MGKKDSFYITTAIDYPSGEPHLGHAYEKICADIIARFQRLLGKNVFFLTGTDEHGKKIEQKAEASNLKPKNYVDKTVVKFKELCNVLNISNDFFIRTTDKEHEKLAQELMQTVFDKGDIYKGSYEGLYCTDCETYYSEREADGTYCPVHKRSLEKLEEESYFFKMGKYRDKLVEHIKKNPDFVRPASRRKELLSRLEDEVRDLSVSRASFSWGIPVPFDKKHVQYVWFDALSNYYTGIQYPKNQLSTFWPADIHLIGKDILWHHTMIWSSMLLSAGIELPKSVFVHGFINLKGEKLSKSSGVKVDPFDLASRYGPDSLRYYLTRSVPFGEDGDFSENELVERVNNELVANICNLTFRSLSFLQKNFDGAVTDCKGFAPDIEKQLAEKYKEIETAYESLNLKNAVEGILQVATIGNKYFQDNEPWKLIKEDSGTAHKILSVCVNVCKDLAVLMSPIIPKTADELWQQIGVDKDKMTWDSLFANPLSDGHKITGASILIKKIEKTKLEKEAFFSLLDLRVAQIVSVESHPDADKLYVVKLDLGKLGKKQLVAGLKEYYAPEELVGKKIVMINNLEHAKLRGVESQGMMLAGEDKKKNVGVLFVEKAEPGEEVTYSGNAKTPAEKVSFDDFIKKSNIVLVDGKATYDGNVLVAGKEEVRCDKKVMDGKVR